MDLSNERNRVSPLDATWLGMDEPTNPMVVNCIMLLRERVEYDLLVATLQDRMVQGYDRFSQRVIGGWLGLGGPRWETDPHFDIRSHVHHVTLPEPGNEQELKRFLSTCMSETLDRSQPLWRVYLIDNLGDGCAVYGRIHHAIGDGIGLMQVVLSMTDTDKERSRKLILRTPRPAEENGAPGLIGASVRRVRAASGSIIASASRGTNRPLDPSLEARGAFAALRSAGLTGVAASANLAKLLSYPPDRQTTYRGELTPIKHVAWTPPLPLERVKAVGSATGATVNDVLVAAVSGGLREFMIAVDAEIPQRDIRALVPINLRPPDATPTLGNKFSFVFLALPISLADPLARLVMTKRRMDALKDSPEPQVVYGLLNLMGIAPDAVSHPVTDWFAGKATCLLTNVPGPRHVVYFAGSRVDRMMFWVPQSRGIGMGISILSYAGDVTVGLMVDEALVPEPERVVDRIWADFEAMERAAAAHVVQ